MEFTPGARSVKISYNGSACRIQIPKMFVASENTTYGTLELVACPEFVSFWVRLEEMCKRYADPACPWNSLLNDGRFKIKIDERTHVFDSDLKLKENGPYMNEYVTCIIELKSIYKFKGMCGITCRMHQMKVHKKVCMI